MPWQGGLVSHHDLDDRFKLLPCRFQLVRPDGAGDHDGYRFGEWADAGHAVLREDSSQIFWGNPGTFRWTDHP
jgi:hypothetical protein